MQSLSAKKMYAGLDQLQNDLDDWIQHYNTERPHSGKYCFGKTPIETFRDSLHLAQEKRIDKWYTAQDAS